MSALVFRVVLAAVPVDNTDNALKPFWNLQPGTTDGGCDQYIENLKVSWEEACLEARQAIVELNFIMNNHNDGAGPDVNNDRSGADRWTRVFNTFLVLFGNPFEGGQFQRDRLLKPRAFFESMVTKCSTRDSLMLQPVYLFCNDDHWQHVKIGEPDPAATTRKIEDTHPQCTSFGGVWYTNKFSVQEGRHFTDWVPPKRQDEGPLCGSRNDAHVAATTRAPHSVTWCLWGLESSVPSVEAIRGDIKGPKLENKKDAKDKIEKGELTLLYKLDSTQKRGKGDMPSTWIHEMGHLLLNFIDEPAVDAKGKNLFEIKSKGVRWDEKQGSWVISKNVPKLTYSWEDCVNLARFNPDAAARSPENLANFATAMYLHEWDWRYGYAQPQILHP